MTPDFSGWATKNNLRCSDGVIIKDGAFKHMDQVKVPMFWNHKHSDPENVLGHAILESRAFGVYAHGYLNNSAQGIAAKEAVKHGDIESLSIFANNLTRRGDEILHGDIKEVSLVMAGANPGALIDNLYVRHSDGSYDELDDEAIIYTGLTLEHSDDTSNTGDNVADNESTSTSESSEKTVQDVFDELTDEQKKVVYYLIGTAVEEAEGNEDSDDEDEDAVKQGEYLDGEDILAHIDNKISEGFTEMTNVFEQNGSAGAGKTTLSHSQVETILADGKRMNSLKDSVLLHAAEYGIEDIDILFPDAKAITNSPEFLSRRTEWVSNVLTGVNKTPFSRVKTVVADITADEARARGYVKGNLKKEEVIKLLKRKTDPTTIYKKQKIDRDDLIDITDLDIVAWLKAEMRLMLDEEIARAILIGDGRSEGDDDKIDEEKIRPIAKDDDFYAHKIEIQPNMDVEEKIETLIRSRSIYRGSGTPTYYTTLREVTDMLLLKDKVGRRIYDSMDALASALMVKEIIPVEVMEEDALVEGIFVNPRDYTVGADKGGEVSMFDDFDIDYNQNKYLMETRISGALTKPKSAIVVTRAAGQEITPQSPSFNGSTNTITIPAQGGVNYLIDGEVVSGQVQIEENTDVTAQPAEGFSFPAGATTSWNFVYTP